jgi:hypothetical protein
VAGKSVFEHHLFKPQILGVHHVSHRILRGNRLNNRADNLRWVTRRENSFDTRKHGRIRNLVLTEDLVRKIKLLKRDGKSQHQTARLLNLKRCTIQAVVSGRTWSDILID